jgi:Domain of unknown function (DUF5666)
MILIAGCASAQVAAPPPTSSDAGPQKAAPSPANPPSARKPEEKIGLVRGVLKRVDPIHDELLVHAFGGRDIRISFDPQTQLLPANAKTPLNSIPAGSVVSVDTVTAGGKLLALTVRTGSSNAAEMNGQVVRYDAAKSRLILRDPLSPGSVVLRITASTKVGNRGQSASPQTLSPGMLVQVWFTPAQNAASRVEILAERGNSFAFEGRIVAVDLRARVLALSNDTDQSVHELAINSLDAASLALLKEGADVNIQAEFDGERYNARTVNLVPRKP